MIQVFVYGTLTDDSVVQSVLGLSKPKSRATLVGYRKVGLNIILAPDYFVNGYLLEVTEDELDKLDRYENYPHLYTRIEVNTSSGKAWVYKLTS